METVNDRFEGLVRDRFQFLETDYNFHICETIKDNYGCFIMYKGSVLAIRVSYEIYDAGIYANFYKLKNGNIPKYPVFFNPAEEFLIFDLNNLLLLRCGKIITQDFKRLHEAAYQEYILKQYADSIKKYALDILNGDFSVLPQLKEIVVRRAKELEHEQ